MTKDLLLAYQHALQVQDACNLSGVLYDWARHMKVLRKVMWNTKKDQEWLNSHPVNILFADKVASLVRMQDLSGDTVDRYHIAYIEAEKIVEEYSDQALIDALQAEVP